MRWPEAIQWHMAADADDVQDAAPRSRRRVLAAGLGLAAVAALPAVVGLSGRDYDDPIALTAAHHAAMWWCAGALAVGGLISWFGLPRGAAPPTDPS